MNATLSDTYARVAAYGMLIALLAGCKNGDTTSTPATAAPGNASSSTISVVDGGGNRLEEVSVTLSTALNGTAASGTIIGTQTTGFTGQAVFDGIPRNGQICASATDRGYAPAGVCRQPFPSSLTLKL